MSNYSRWLTEIERRGATSHTRDGGFLAYSSDGEIIGKYTSDGKISFIDDNGSLDNSVIVETDVSSTSGDVEEGMATLRIAFGLIFIAMIALSGISRVGDAPNELDFYNGRVLSVHEHHSKLGGWLTFTLSSSNREFKYSSYLSDSWEVKEELKAAKSVTVGASMDEVYYLEIDGQVLLTQDRARSSRKSDGWATFVVYGFGFFMLFFFAVYQRRATEA